MSGSVDSSPLRDGGVTPLDASLADRGRLAESYPLAYIDTLRGVAILMVIWVHHGLMLGDTPYGRWLSSYGQMGVQLFFVASAFTLGLSTKARRDEPHPVSSFYIRRLFRIAPLYYVGILIYAGMWGATRGHDGIHSHEFHYTPFVVLMNMLFIHSLFVTAFNDVVPGGWSIGTEMMFYLIFPWLLLAMRSVPARFGAHRFAVIVALGWIACAAALVGISRLSGLAIVNNGILYCSLLNNLPVFLIGISGFILIVEDGRFAPRLVRDICCCLALTAVAMLLKQDGSALAIMALPAVAGMSFIFLLNVARATVTKSGLLERIGQVSFSMYIFHFLFAWPLTKKIVQVGDFLPHAKYLLYLPTLLLTIGLTFIVARLSKRLIEDRFIRLGKRLIRRLDAPAISARL